MKVLIDQNISFRIVSQISDMFSGVSHVKSLGLIDAKDFDIFMFARKEGFQAILTQD
jgi:predicted nuclease of predicted toxin-antitoxin system